ncbi:uncharacterized protein PV06_01627 [Exophiala oligosperma]|uniref:Queuine tRNA-ribosyltransferase accessory subunit 2 n=1 Tax=Exophiala oligosperma TaxID=215243 RepID=A0A0D2B1A7_9EURO|nr:uncharacterized protein PV06_01627 [Exophiala oligosperma]KIW45921.1 hypothetical protein PV06_01627 [Exophiala oligosperma]
MAQLDVSSLGQLPDEMLKFVLQHGTVSEAGARLGQLTVHNRSAIQTPHYIVPTSRGAIPHLSQDNVQKHTRISAAYVSLEDFIEKSAENAPIYTTPTQNGDSALRNFTGLPSQCLSILGPRRVPSITPPAHNTNSSVTISTSVGFRFLELKHYNEALRKLKADLSTSLADVIPTENASLKRIARSADRTHAWLRDTIEQKDRDGLRPFFASIPPLDSPLLSLYLDDIRDEYKEHISGLCLYSPASTPELPDSLRHLPRICVGNPTTPQALLASIDMGVDMMTIPFVTQASEFGIALSFSFPGSSSSSSSSAAETITTTTQPLGIDMWSATYATDTSPLSEGCTCYTCRRHHRAYVHHLLQAKEMLAWALLQIHNYSVLDSFFDRVRESIKRRSFDDDSDTFNRLYESELPKQTGQGPRIRGYQMKSVGGAEARKNQKAWGKVDEQLQKLAEAESGVATPDGDANDIEEHV